MTGIVVTNFFTHYTAISSSPIQVPKDKVSHHFRKGWHYDGSIRRLSNGWVAVGRMQGNDF